MTHPKHSSHSPAWKRLTVVAATAALLCAGSGTLHAQLINPSNNAAQSLSGTDKSFFMKAARASTNEVALSQLAESRSSNPDVKALAQMMISDHSRMNSSLQALATDKGIDLAKPILKGENDDVSSLSAKFGDDFDKAYAEKMVEAHK